jgi:hypothetical protein
LRCSLRQVINKVTVTVLRENMGNIEIHYDQTTDLTVVIATGKITAGDMFAAAQKYLADNPTGKVLWNFMEADGAHIKSEDFRNLHIKISRLPNIQKNKKIALVVSRDVGYGLSRLSAIYAEQAGIKAEFNVFRSLEEAMKWLEIHK